MYRHIVKTFLLLCNMHVFCVVIVLRMFFCFAMCIGIVWSYIVKDIVWFRHVYRHSMDILLRMFFFSLQCI